MHDPHRRAHPGIAEDYTAAFLCMAYLLLFMSLITIWGLWGYPVALLICTGLHAALTRWQAVRARADD
ncbi:hypothetical protein JQC91_13710 [Jannaschia sp. Os4]|uniref:hypothetical protein n=1 Tax=Jannaschia sp. Os4 TaxID=2807617 RepID=UPI00193ADE79|nr:hypothetical protein [Jannaschia sp. Os4]MBM2577360.1 hypothetical protein [Jannaschia sp. Os4]